MLPLWLGSIVLVKVLHEFGHALACRHFGARPGEMGVLLLAGVPSLYCDVSDAWKLPSKWQRMGVSAGGMAVELVIAAVAALVWRSAEPGVVRAIALSLIVVCSVGTLLINANPLLRYDGYYLLADFLEVPNLAERARGLVGGAWRRWLLGETEPVDPLLSPQKRRALWIYAILAKAYMLLVLAGLLTLMLKLARPHQLQNVVYTLAAITLVGMLLGPADDGEWRQSRRPRPAAMGSRAPRRCCSCDGCRLLVPMTRRVAAPLVIVPAQAHPLFAEVAGELEFAAAEGAAVAAGDIVVRLRNPELELALVEAEGAVRERRTRLHQLRTLQSAMPAAARRSADCRGRTRRRRAATRRAASDGRVADGAGGPSGPRRRGARSPDRTSPRPRAADMARFATSAEKLGAWIDAGTPLGIVAAAGGSTAWAGVEQADVPAVEPGQPVRLVVEQRPWEVLTGRVTEVSQRARINHRQEPGNAKREATSRRRSLPRRADRPGRPVAVAAPRIRGMAKISTYESSVGQLV